MTQYEKNTLKLIAFLALMFGFGVWLGWQYGLLEINY